MSFLGGRAAEEKEIHSHPLKDGSPARTACAGDDTYHGMAGRVPAMPMP